MRQYPEIASARQLRSAAHCNRIIFVFTQEQKRDKILVGDCLKPRVKTGRRVRRCVVPASPRNRKLYKIPHRME